MLKIFKYFLTLLFFSIGLIQHNISAVAINDLKAGDFVNDYANVLSAEEENLLNQKLSDLEKNTSGEVAVAIVQNMSGDYVEHYAVKLFESWKIGKKKKDNGALLLISIDDRKMRIEVGYGLESTLTDGKSAEVVNNILKPNFKNNYYYKGIDEAVNKITEILNDKDASSVNVSNTTDRVNLWEFFFQVLPFILFFGFTFLQWLIAVLARTKSWWLGGVMGSGLGGFVIFLTGFTLFSEITFVILMIFGFILDYFVSKNYKNHKNGIVDGPPDWWSGGVWAPGSSTWTGSSGNSFGGFGGGSSGGGGFSGDW